MEPEAVVPGIVEPTVRAVAVTTPAFAWPGRCSMGLFQPHSSACFRDDVDDSSATRTRLHMWFWRWYWSVRWLHKRPVTAWTSQLRLR